MLAATWDLIYKFWQEQFGSPHLPAHIVMGRVFNETSKNDYALAPKCRVVCLRRLGTVPPIAEYSSTDDAFVMTDILDRGCSATRQICMKKSISVVVFYKAHFE